MAAIPTRDTNTNRVVDFGWVYKDPLAGPSLPTCSWCGERLKYHHPHDMTATCGPVVICPRCDWDVLWPI